MSRLNQDMRVKRGKQEGRSQEGKEAISESRKEPVGVGVGEMQVFVEKRKCWKGSKAWAEEV